MYSYIYEGQYYYYRPTPTIYDYMHNSYVPSFLYINRWRDGRGSSYRSTLYILLPIFLFPVWCPTMLWSLT